MKALWFDVESIVTGLLVWSLTAAVVVTFGAGLSRLLSHWAASYRHAVWFATSVCVLVTPVVSSWIPGMLPRYTDIARNESQFATISEVEKAGNSVLPQSENSTTMMTSEPASEALNVSDLQNESESRLEKKQTRTRASNPTTFPQTGGVLWTDSSPGDNILHGQWSSPAYAVLGDVPQVIYGGGDGYLYGFLAHGENGNSKLLWKFDCNPKDSKYELGGRATRNNLIATPVIYDGFVYVAVGEDPEHGEGIGHLWCVDPTKRGDVSPTLVFNTKSPNQPIEHKRIQALVAREGDFQQPNPNSAAVWHYIGNNPEVFEQTMHRTVSTVAIKNDLLFVPDFSGVFHCLDAKTGKSYWTYDLFAACWASPMIVDDHVYLGDEDGDMAVFKLSKERELLSETNFVSAIYTTPVVANDTLFIVTRNRLWALQEGALSVPNKK